MLFSASNLSCSKLFVYQFVLPRCVLLSFSFQSCPFPECIVSAFLFAVFICQSCPVRISSVVPFIELFVPFRFSFSELSFFRCALSRFVMFHCVLFRTVLFQLVPLHNCICLVRFLNNCVLFVCTFPFQDCPFSVVRFPAFSFSDISFSDSYCLRISFP